MKIVVKKLFSQRGEDVCGTTVNLLFVKDGNVVQAQRFTGKVLSKYIRVCDNVEYDSTVLAKTESAVFEYEIVKEN